MPPVERRYDPTARSGDGAGTGTKQVGGAGWNRRALLGATLAAGALACGSKVRPSDEGDGATPEPVADPTAFDLLETSIAELGAQMHSGERTARQITELYLERIARHDRDGVGLRAVIETNPDALAIAEGLDAERAAGQVRGPLHGIPILLKDNIDTADRNTTTAGSLALEGSIPRRDAYVAARLRQAGAVLLGKANLSEWANFRSTESSSGWSARGGQCRNPYALDRNPCGSSSGSGAATSAR